MGPRCTLKRVIARQIIFSEHPFPSRHLSGMQFSEVEAPREAIRGATRDRGGLPTRFATSTVKEVAADKDSTTNVEVSFPSLSVLIR